VDWTNGRVRGRIWRFAHCEYDEIERQLWVSGKSAELPDKPLEVLAALLRAPQRMLTKDQLIATVWPDFGNSDGNEEGSLTQAVRQLRRAFKLEDRNAIIRTLHGVGYELAVPVATRTNEKSVEPQVRLIEGSFIPGKGEWKLTRPLDKLEPHWVWLAEKPTTRQIRVFKFAEDGVRLEALQREITLSRFFEKTLADSSSFVKVYDWRLTTKPYLIESEYGGLNLEEWANSQRDGGGLSRADCLQVVADLAETVGAAHNLGVLHNDLKPGNVLISPAPGADAGWKVKVCDFGIASLNEPEQLAQRLEALDITNLGFGQAGVAGGSVLYRAPEIRPGQPSTVAADIYALGVILFQLLCGDFRQTPAPGWQQQIDDPILREDIEATVNLNPALRLQNPFELAQRLRTLEARRAERERAAREQGENARIRQQVERDRARRPFVWGAVAALTVGLCASLWFYRRAVREERVAEQINSFLADDLLRESNPDRGQGVNETLNQAIQAVAPQIDQRFSGEPRIAATLHDAIAGALDNQNEFLAAGKQFDDAAAKWIETDGPLSQNAMFSQYQHVFTEIRSRLPGSMDRGKKLMGQEDALFGRLRSPWPKVAFVKLEAEGLLAMRAADLATAQAKLQQGMEIAAREPTLGFNMKATAQERLCDAQMMAGEAAKGETCMRSLLEQERSYAGESETRAGPEEVVIAESLLLQGRYQAAIDETTRLYPKFVKQLGEDNPLTLQLLTTRAAAEGTLERWDDSIRDDLAASAGAAKKDPKSFFVMGGLTDAALSECRAGRYKDGEAHAREAMKMASGADPGLRGGMQLSLASCIIASPSGRTAAPARLAEAEHLLDEINIPAVIAQTGDPGWGANVDLARAQLAWVRHDRKAASAFLDKAKPALSAPASDPFQHRAVDDMTRNLQQAKSAGQGNP
jgi:serine/threonine protein kinase